jgi:hypothetical protein
MQNDFFQKLSELHPFITVCHYAGQDYVGIVQNKDDSVTTLYDYGAITSPELKELFLELGSSWWYESNRLVSINIFLKQEWSIFKPYLRTFNNKSLTVLHGPVCSMSDLSKRKNKRRTVTMVRRLS